MLQTAEPAPLDLMTPEQLAAELQIGVKTLANWRSARVGPPYTKVGGCVRYSRAAVLAHLADEQLKLAERVR